MASYWSLVQKTGSCWLWLGKLGQNGYAKYGKWWVHRYAYELAKGPIPDGLVIDHLCRVRHCVNPDHLEAVTQRENVLRWKRLITHCPQGHPYDAANTSLAEGSRRCLACKRDRMNVAYSAAHPGHRGKPSLRTHCPSGHPYDDANTYVYKGSRRCRTCIRSRP